VIKSVVVLAGGSLGCRHHDITCAELCRTSLLQHRTELSLSSSSAIKSVVVLAGSSLGRRDHASENTVTCAELRRGSLLDEGAIAEHQKVITVKDGVDPAVQTTNIAHGMTKHT
jgi:hypothetical protein